MCGFVKLSLLGNHFDVDNHTDVGIHLVVDNHPSFAPASQNPPSFKRGQLMFARVLDNLQVTAELFIPKMALIKSAT